MDAGEVSDDPVTEVAASLGLVLGSALPARSNESWRVRRNDEPMLLVDWWSQALTLAAGSLRRSRQPDWWELGALRRQFPLALRLERL